MKIPKSIKIGGHVYKVKFPYTFEERSDVDGHTNFSTNEILITDANTAGVKCHCKYVESIFWHEILHVIDRTYCCDMVGSNTDKESMIEGLAQGLLQVLTDNFEELKPKQKPRLW